MRNEVNRPSEPPFPERIGRFELLLRIGAGGMGSVYLGRFEVVPGLFRQVAVKLMHPQFHAEEPVADALLHEAQLAARIRHPNVVHVVEAGQEPQGVYLAMDYVRGETLAGLIRGSIKTDSPLPLRIVARILDDILAGLQAAHELRDEQGRHLQVVHRDVSPPNVLVGLDGTSQLTDFGIAKSIGRLSATATGVVKGKVGYMAPEQALGQTVDARSDVWAVGVMAWEMVAGRRLFRAANDTATMLMVVSPEPCPRLASERPEVGGAFDELVAAALESDVARRLGSAGEFRRRLAAALEPHGGLAEPKDIGRLVHKLAGKRLAKRREQLAEVIRLRQRLGHVARSAASAVRADGLDGTGWESGGESTEKRAAPTGPTRSERPAHGLGAALASAASVSARRRGLIALAGTLMLVGGAVGWAGLRREKTTPPSDSFAVTANGAAGVASSERSPETTTALAASTRTSADGRARLQLRANAPLVQVRVDHRPPTLLPEAARQLDLVLHEDDRARPLTLLAVARDGRRIVVHVAADQHEVELGFRALPRQPRSNATKDIDGPGLVR